MVYDIMRLLIQRWYPLPLLLVSIIEKFSSNNNKTILIASHNMIEVERLCDEVMMMKKGEIIDKGKSSDLISKHGRKNLEEVFLKLARN